jgi:hypothetical protein
MEHYPLLKMLHMLPGILLLIGVPVHLFMLWKASRSGDAAVLQRKLKRTDWSALHLQRDRFLRASPGVAAAGAPLSRWGWRRGGLRGAQGIGETQLLPERVPMSLQELLLLAAERFDHVGPLNPPATQRLTGRLMAPDQFTGRIETDPVAIKELVDMGREQ